MFLIKPIIIRSLFHVLIKYLGNLILADGHQEWDFSEQITKLTGIAGENYWFLVFYHSFNFLIFPWLIF